MLSQRQEQILKIMVGEYVSTARPVGSALIGRKHGLGISSATIRNEMARLEEEGYITRLHISGGGVPSDQGYRFYVKSLTQGSEGVSLEERRMLSHLFHQIEMELEEWTRLAAALLARMVHNVAVVTSPKAAKSRIKHLELVALQESLALLILLLQEAKLRQHLIAFDSVVSQGELSMVSNEFNELFNGMTWPQVVSKQAKLTSIGEQVKDALVQVMVSEDERIYEEPYVEGVCNMLAQPEFERHQNMLKVMELLERKDMVSLMLPEELVGDGVQVLIGDENREEAMKECSLVFTQYGVPDEVKGAIGVIGPTRMQYARAISAVSYMGSLMSELVTELHTGFERQ